MDNTTNQSDVQKLKSAGRDLMPIIAVCVTAIVLTLVSVTGYKLLENHSGNIIKLQPSILEEHYLNLLSNAEERLLEGDLETALEKYLAARDMAIQEKASPIFLAELEVRLARIMVEQRRPKQAKKHMTAAVAYLQDGKKTLQNQIRDLQKIIDEEDAAEKQQNGAVKKDPEP